MIYYIHKDADNLWRWRLAMSMNRTLAYSAEGYEKKESCLRAISLVSTSVRAPVVEEWKEAYRASG